MKEEIQIRERESDDLNLLSFGDDGRWYIKRAKIGECKYEKAHAHCHQGGQVCLIRARTRGLEAGRA